MGQPVMGLVASALVIAVSLAYLALFDFGTFVGWVAFAMLCLIPAQVVTVVLAPNPPYAKALHQPSRGLVLLVVNLIVAAVITPIALYVAGEGIGPPGPIPSHYVVIVVPTAFFLAIMFGGWPFTTFSRNGGVISGLALLTSYVLTYGIFRVFFDYDFMRGAPVYLASAPSGMFNGEVALVFYVTALAGMFLMLHFDLWPFTMVPGVMKQPVLGLVWLVVALAVGAAVMWVAGGQFGMRPMYIMTRITAPFIFGTIIVLNMLQNSLFASLKQPVKGLANAVAATVIGVALAQAYGLFAPAVPPDVPDAYEVWLVNALLSVTFPFLIFYAAYFNYWPLAGAPKAAEEPVRT